MAENDEPKDLKDMTDEELIAEAERRSREQCAYEDEALKVSRVLIETMMELTMVIRGHQLDPAACCGLCGLGNTVPNDLAIIECRKRAPKQVMAKSGLGATPISIFPIMARNEKACGDFQAKVKE